MTIKNILFLKGWGGESRIKAEIINDNGQAQDVIIEEAEARRIILDALNAGARLTLAAGQKLYRIEAVPPYTQGMKDAQEGYKILTAKKRLEYLRRELRHERISYGELAELRELIPYIESGDVELLEAAGVPEHDEG